MSGVVRPSPISRLGRFPECRVYLLHASFGGSGRFGRWSTGGSEGSAGRCKRQVRGTIARISREQRRGQGPRVVREARRAQAGGHELRSCGVGGGTVGTLALRPVHAVVPSVAPSLWVNLGRGHPRAGRGPGPVRLSTVRALGRAAGGAGTNNGRHVGRPAVNFCPPPALPLLASPAAG